MADWTTKVWCLSRQTSIKAQIGRCNETQRRSVLDKVPAVTQALVAATASAASRGEWLSSATHRLLLSGSMTQDSSQASLSKMFTFPALPLNCLQPASSATLRPFFSSCPTLTSSRCLMPSSGRAPRWRAPRASTALVHMPTHCGTSSMSCATTSSAACGLTMLIGSRASSSLTRTHSHAMACRPWPTPLYWLSSED